MPVRHAQLWLEALEDRTVLSTVTQTFQGTGAQFDGNRSVSAFLGDTFDASASFGSIRHVDYVGDFGATASMNIGGRAGLDLTFSGAGGTVSATHTVSLTQDFTHPNRFGEYVSFNPGNTFASVTGGSFSTTSPSFGYGVDLDLGLHGRIGGEFAVFDRTSGSFSFGGDLSLPLMSVNENDSGVVRILGMPMVGASPGLGLDGTLQRLVGAIQNFATGYALHYGVSTNPPLRLKLDLRTPQALQFVQNLQLQLAVPAALGPFTVSTAENFRANVGLDLGTITEQAPKIDLATSQLQTGGLLTATGRSNAAQLSIQTGPIASWLLGAPGLAALSSTVNVNLGPLSAAFTPLSFQLQPTLFASQTATVQPVSELTYNFSDASGYPLAVRATVNGTPVNSGNPTFSVKFTPGKDTLGVQFQGQPITVTPTWTFRADLRNQVDLKASLDALWRWAN